MLKEKIRRIVDPSLVGLKLFVFCCLLFTGVAMYLIDKTMIGNDILIVMALFIIFNKLDNIEK